MTVMPASLATSERFTGPLPCPGRFGAGVSFFGTGGAGNFSLGMARSRSGELAHGGARGVQVLADAVEGLARVAGREALELAVDREARPDLELAAADAGVEAVERADGRAAVHLAAEVVDAAVAWAHEAPGGFDEADRAAEVHAARRDRDELVVLVGRLSV